MIRQVRTICVLLLSLGGCAVLNVDVDVYKGPLANHKDVQLQQLAQFAIGAQHLLVKLCQEEENHTQGGDPQNCTTPTERRGNNHITKQVQELLELYDDLLPQEVLAQIELLGEQLGTYEKAYKQAFPDQTDANNKKLWGDLQREMWPVFTNEHPAIVKAGDSKREEVKRALQYLKDAYGKFLTGEQVKQSDPDDGIRDQDLLLCAQAKLYAPFKGNAYQKPLLGFFDPEDPATTGLERPYYVTKQGENEYDKKCELAVPYEQRFKNRRSLDPTSATAEFEGLLRNNAELIVKHAALLFPEQQEEARRKFVDVVKAASNSFLVTRQHADHMLQTSLELITLVHKPSAFVPKSTQEHLLDAIANLSVELIRPRYLWYALENTALSSSDKVTVKILRDHFEDTLKESYRYLYSPPDDFKDGYSGILTRRLKDDPSAAVAILLAHQGLIKQFASPDESRLYAIKFTLADFGKYRKEYDEDKAKWEHRSGAQRRYGISHGEPPPKLKEIQSRLMQVRQVPGLLHKGRSLEGIASLSKAYGVAINSSPPYTRLTQKDRLLEQKLHNTLIHFAQKVLIVGNLDVLTELPESQTTLDKIGFALTSIFSLSKAEEPSSRGDKSPSTERMNRYHSVLQAIGNSILIQADELRARREHEDRLAARAEDEIWALKESLTQTAPQVISGLITDLNADLGDLPKKIASLESQRNQAEKAKEAAQTLRDQRSDAYTLASGKMTELNQKRKELQAHHADIEIAGQTLNKISDRVKAVLPISAPNPSNDMQQLATWVENELKQYPAKDPSEWPKQLKVLQEFLGNYGKVIQGRINTYTDTESFLSKVSAAIREHKADVSKDLQKRDSEVNQHQSALATSVEEKADSEKRLNEIVATVVALASEKAQLENDKLITALALQKVLDLRPNIITDIAGLSDSGAKIFTLLISRIGEQRRDPQGNRTTDADKLDKVIKLLNEKSPQNDQGLAERLAQKGGAICKGHFDGTPGCKTSKELLDDVIGLLRHEYLQAVKTTGKEGKQAEKLQSAMKAAWDLRSDMVYIRPSGAYLRSSFPSTSLQDDPALVSENLLAEKALLHMPFDMPLRLICQLALPKSAESICKDDDYSKHRAQNALDKQFWQNINRVKLTGGGWTNYVVAKDDIGNWYVKEVATDPKDIIRAAKKLALFGLGTAGTTALASAVSQKTTDGESTATDQPMPPLQQVYAKYRDAYESANSELVSQLKKKLGSDGIRKTIQLSWEGHPLLKDRLGDLNTALSHAAAQLDDAKSALVNAKDYTERPLHIANALKSILRFHNDIQSSIHTMDLAAKEKEAVAIAKRDFEKVDASQKDEKKKAAEKVEADEAALKTKQDAAASASKVVRDTCFETLTSQLKDSQVANKEYEKSLMFIGEVRAGTAKSKSQSDYGAISGQAR